MKVRDSGMPEREYWESLFDVPLILERLGVGPAIRDAVEVGCGYGTFSVPVARRISGVLHTFDIEAAMVTATQARAQELKVANIRVSHRDVVADGFGLEPGRFDAVLLFNILHAEEPVELLRASGRLLSPSGKVLVIHWRSDIATPRGPALSIRPRAEQVCDWARTASLVCEQSGEIAMPPWHYGVVLRRRAELASNRPPLPT